MRRGGFETRPAFQNMAGNAVSGNEVNEGTYCINQIPPGTYCMSATDQNGGHARTLPLVGVTFGMNSLDIELQ